MKKKKNKKKKSNNFENLFNVGVLKNYMGKYHTGGNIPIHNHPHDETINPNTQPGQILGGDMFFSGDYFSGNFDAPQRPFYGQNAMIPSSESQFDADPNNMYDWNNADPNLNNNTNSTGNIDFKTQGGGFEKELEEDIKKEKKDINKANEKGEVDISGILNEGSSSMGNLSGMGSEIGAGAGAAGIAGAITGLVGEVFGGIQKISKIASKDYGDDIGFTQTTNKEFKKGGKIELDPAKKGTFKALAKRKKMSMDALVRDIKENPEKYSSKAKMKANFYQNFVQKKEAGGLIEVEGGEVIETPDGSLYDIVGPKHEQGGVLLNVYEQGGGVPDGSYVYSDALKKQGDSMANRKKKRNKRLNNIEMLAEQNAFDKIIGSTLDQEMFNYTLEERGDKELMEIASAEDKLKQMQDFNSKFDEYIAKYGGKVKGDRGIMDYYKNGGKVKKKKYKHTYKYNNGGKISKEQENDSFDMLNLLNQNMQLFSDLYDLPDFSNLNNNPADNSNFKANLSMPYPGNIQASAQGKIGDLKLKGSLDQNLLSDKFSPNWKGQAELPINKNMNLFGNIKGDFEKGPKEGNVGVIAQFNNGGPILSSADKQDAIKVIDALFGGDKGKYQQAVADYISANQFGGEKIDIGKDLGYEHVGSSDGKKIVDNTIGPKSKGFLKSKYGDDFLKSLGYTDVLEGSTQGILKNQLKEGVTPGIYETSNVPGLYQVSTGDIQPISVLDQNQKDIDNLLNEEVDLLNVNQIGNLQNTGENQNQNYDFTLGDQLGMFGSLFGPTSSLYNTMLNAAATPENRSMFETYMNRALGTMEGQKGFLGQQKAKAIKDAKIAQETFDRKTRRDVRSKNVLSALGMFSNAQQQKSIGNIADQFAKNMMALTGQIAQMQSQQDYIKMSKRDEANVRNQKNLDNFFTEMGKAGKDIGTSLQQMGRNLNIKEQDKDFLSMLKYLNKYDLSLERTPGGGYEMYDTKTGQKASDARINSVRKEINKNKK